MARRGTSVLARVAASLEVFPHLGQLDWRGMERCDRYRIRYGDTGSRGLSHPIRLKLRRLECEIPLLLQGNLGFGCGGVWLLP